MKGQYILQDIKDDRLYLKGFQEDKNYPIFTANRDNAAVYDDNAARLFSKAFKLKMIKL